MEHDIRFVDGCPAGRPDLVACSSKGLSLMSIRWWSHFSLNGSVLFVIARVTHIKPDLPQWKKKAYYKPGETKTCRLLFIHLRSKQPEVCWLNSEFQLESLSAAADLAAGWFGPPISTEVKLLSNPEVAKQGGIVPPDTTITLSFDYKFVSNRLTWETKRFEYKKKKKRLNRWRYWWGRRFRRWR